MKIHYCVGISPERQKTTISVIGAGGTGSLLLQQLARINVALIALGQKGLHVRCFDNDKITPANKGRQLYTDADIGRNKAEAMISKINRFFGFDWEAYDVLITDKTDFCLSNITVLCVDNIKTRLNVFKSVNTRHRSYEFNPMYVIDCGNSYDKGQVFLSTAKEIVQPKSKFKTVSKIKDSIKLYGKSIYDSSETDQPSCSLAEALSKQDIMINQFIATFAAKMIRDMLVNSYIDYQAVFINLQDMTFLKKQL